MRISIAMSFAIRTRGADELSLDEQLAREADRISRRLKEIQLARSGMAQAATAPEAMAAPDVVPIDLEPRMPRTMTAEHKEKMMAARKASAAMRAEMMADANAFATDDDDHMHLAKHADKIDEIIVNENDAPLKKADDELVRAVSTLFKRAVATGQHGGKREKSRVATYLMKDTAGRKKMMKGKGFGDFMRKVGSTLWNGVKLASQVAVPIVGAVAPEFLPVAAGIAGAVQGVDAAVKRKDAPSTAAAVGQTITAGSRIAQAIGNTTTAIPS